MRLLGDAATFAALLNGKTVNDIEAISQPELDAFIARRARFLLYD